MSAPPVDPPSPPPRPPEPPLASDCCDSGCARCVFEVYADEQAHYQQALAAWQAAQPGRRAASAEAQQESP